MNISGRNTNKNRTSESENWAKVEDYGKNVEPKMRSLAIAEVCDVEEQDRERI